MKIGLVIFDEELRRMLAAEVSAMGHKAYDFGSLQQALTNDVRMIFAEWVVGERLPGLLAGLRAAAAQEAQVPVVVLAPTGAATAMKRAREAGAADVLFAPPDAEEIRAEIEEACSGSSELLIAHTERFRALRRERLIGEDRAFLRVIEELKRAAKADANVLLSGETGTGKEMFADAIHALGSRAGQPFLAVNCASLPGPLLEAELFGHAKGAFTGADRERAGRFEEVGAGTLLLDEIGDVELHLQTKLLRAVEQRAFQRLGENKDRRLHARLICATSVDLEKAVETGRFRSDLLGRIDQFRIVLPPLRQRRADIRVLARHFLRKHSRGRLVEFSKSVLEVLEDFDFPMNVRQLENAVIGALLRSDPGPIVLPKHLPPEMTTAKAASDAAVGRSISLPTALPYKQAREHATRAVDQLYLTELLQKHNHNQTRVAEEAGIDRKTLRERLRAAGYETEEPLED